MKELEAKACNEYWTLTRRQMMAGAATLIATGPVWMPKVAFAKGGSLSRDRLIVVNLRGGADGLSMCAPVGDPVYASSRPNIAVPAPGSGSNAGIDIDGYFAFPRAFQDFTDPFGAKHMAVVHAVGRQNWTFSHFEAARWMEHGSKDVATTSGWLARHLATVSELVPDAEIRALNINEVEPTILHEGDRIFSSSYPMDVKFSATYKTIDASAIQDTYLRQYQRLRDDTRSSVRDGVRAINNIASFNLVNYVPSSGVVYDTSQFGKGMKATAALMKADAGIEVFHIDIYGWDTHIDQGTTDGVLNEKMLDLSRNVTSLYRDLMASGITNWTLVVVSEFGRRVNENGGTGSEHGEGNAMLVLSPNLSTSAGGRVVTDWPGIETQNRTVHDGLNPTRDDRDIWSEILTKRLNNPNMNFVFPGFTATQQNILFDAA